MTTESKAVFLSYASEDGVAARRIADALKAAGVEVWFDQSELRGGDAWDRQIRKQIHDCALFIPIISSHSHARLEGYFRREWKLAVDRTHDMAEEKAFLLPVVIDETSERTATVPDRFRDVQWTRLLAADAPTALVERTKRLLAGEPVAAPEHTQIPSATRAQAAAPQTEAGDAPRWRIRLRKRDMVLAIGVVAVLAGGYFALASLRRPSSATEAALSIAVLPLVNESGEAGQQYFSDGISEDLITTLSQFPRLKVIGRTSAFQFRDTKESSRSIGAKLGVAHLLEGSVRRSGEMVRISAELIDTADGSTQWSDRYDRPYKDLFALQDDITHAVATALKAKLIPGEHAVSESERPPSGSLDAYNAFLQGRFYAPRQTEADLDRATDFLTRATQIDPRYALAWSELSRALNDIASNYLSGVAAQDVYAKGRAAADRALALAPDLAAAHTARGDLFQRADFNWRAAQTEYRRALELAPNDADARLNLGIQLATYGDLHQAIELTRQALVTEPLRASGYKWLGVYLLALGRLDEADRAMHKAIELQPAAPQFHAWLTIIEIHRGNAQAALEVAQRTEPGPFQDMALAFARQIGTDRNAADAALRTLIEKQSDIVAYQIAEVYALRGDREATFKWLDTAWANRDSGIAYLLYDPFIQRYKDDPRFAAFCVQVDLPVPKEIGQ